MTEAVMDGGVQKSMKEILWKNLTYDYFSIIVIIHFEDPKMSSTFDADWPRERSCGRKLVLILYNVVHFRSGRGLRGCRITTASVGQNLRRVGVRRG